MSRSKFMLFATVLSLLTFYGSAEEIYRWVDKNGVVHFGDQSGAPEHAEAMEVKPITTVPAIDVPEQGDDAAASDEEPRAASRSIDFLSPEANSAMHSGSGDIQVALAIQPALASNEQIHVQLDGAPVFQGNTTTFPLKGVYRGSHQLTAEVIGKSGQVEASKSITFTVHRPRVGR